MSLRESIHIYHPLDIERFLQILQAKYKAKEHPSQPGAYLIGDPELPFYHPEQADGYVFVIGFNYVPLPYLMLQGLLDHPELVSEDTLIRWTAEQDLVWEGTIKDLRDQDL